MTSIYSRSAVRERIMARSAVVEQSSSAFETMIEEAVVLHKAQRFEAAIEKNVDLVACLEGNAKTHSMEVSKEVHAMAVHNLGSALHQLGHFEVAKAFYSEAVTELSTAEKDPFDFIWKMFGDVRAAQMCVLISHASYPLYTPPPVPPPRPCLLARLHQLCTRSLTPQPRAPALPAASL